MHHECSRPAVPATLVSYLVGCAAAGRLPLPKPLEDAGGHLGFVCRLLCGRSDFDGCCMQLGTSIVTTTVTSGTKSDLPRADRRQLCFGVYKAVFTVSAAAEVMVQGCNRATWLRKRCWWAVSRSAVQAAALSLRRVRNGRFAWQST